VEFLEPFLCENIAEELNCIDNDDILRRLERAFLITDVQSKMMGIQTSGATVVVCLIKKHYNKTTIYAANAGDARAVLSCIPATTERKLQRQKTSKKAYRLTYDHRADDPKELQRINKSGGFIARNRVMGVFAVARSLGAFYNCSFLFCFMIFVLIISYALLYSHQRRYWYERICYCNTIFEYS